LVQQIGYPKRIIYFKRIQERIFTPTRQGKIFFKKNGNPPIVIACQLDNSEILKFFLEEAKIEKKLKNTKMNSEISIPRLVIIHDAVNCFRYLFPDVNEESEELNDLYILSKIKNSEGIIKIFEQDQINLDFDFDMFRENEAMTVV
jgi:hypothetical protein